MNFCSIRSLLCLTGSFDVTAVAVHPTVCKQCCSNAEEKYMLIMLIISFLEELFRIKLSRQYSIVTETTYNPGLKTFSCEKFFPKAINNEKQLVTPDPSSLVKKVYEMERGPQDEKIKICEQTSCVSFCNSEAARENTVTRSKKSKRSEIKMDGQTKSPLVDHFKIKLQECETAKSSGPGQNSDIPDMECHSNGDIELYAPRACVDMKEIATTYKKSAQKQQNISLAMPRHEIEILPAEGCTSGKIKIVATLQNVLSVDSCNLDVTQEQMTLVVPEQYMLKIDMPFPINSENVSAKFDKSKSLLTVVMESLLNTSLV